MNKDNKCLKRTALCLALTSLTLTAMSAPIAITTATAKLETISRIHSSIGTIEPQQLSVIQAKTSGQINAITVNIGSQVKKGQLLASIEPTSEKIKLNIAQAAYDKAKAAYQSEHANYLRAKSLVANGSLSKSKWQLQQAREAELKGTLSQAKSNLHEAKLQYSYTNIKAKVDGTVYKKEAKLHSVVTIGTPLFVVATTKKLRAVLPLPAKDRPAIKTGQTVKLSSLHQPSKTLTRKITGISPIISPSSRSFNAFVDFTNNGHWYPGDSVKGLILTGKEKLVALPQQCIVYKSGSPEVFLLNNGTVKAQPVTIELSDSNLVYIKGGLQPGEIVAAKGANYLFNGSKVTIKQ